MSGCSTFKVNPEAALYVLDAFHDPEYAKADYVGHLASQLDFARAHSCAAHAHYQKFKASDVDRVLDASIERHYSRRQTVEAGFGCPAHTSFKFALYHASESARLGLVSSIVLRVGFTAREIGEGLGVDFGQLPHRAKNYRPLWRAVGNRVSELYAEARQALEASQRDPFDYACSNEGCTTRAKSSASLKACSGKCPSDLKPHYCSKQCQVKVRPVSAHDEVLTMTATKIQHWPRHKAICKPGYGGKVPEIPDKSVAREWFELEDPEPKNTSTPPGVQCDLRDGSISDDLQRQDDSPDRIVVNEKLQKSYRSDTSEEAVHCTIHDHDIAVVEHAPCGAEDSPNVQDSEDPGRASLISSDLSVTPTSRLDDVQTHDDGLHATDGAEAPAQESPREEAVQRAAKDAGEDITMLLVTEHVFYCKEDSQRPWSHHYLAMRTACFLDYHNARHSPCSELALESQCARNLAELSNQQISERWKGDDSDIRPAATLEMALRCVPSSSKSTSCFPCSPYPQGLSSSTHRVRCQVYEWKLHRKTQAEPRSCSLRARRLPQPRTQQGRRRGQHREPA